MNVNEQMIEIILDDYKKFKLGLANAKWESQLKDKEICELKNQIESLTIASESQTLFRALWNEAEKENDNLKLQIEQLKEDIKSFEATYNSSAKSYKELGESHANLFMENSQLKEEIKELKTMTESKSKLIDDCSYLANEWMEKYNKNHALLKEKDNEIESLKLENNSLKEQIVEKNKSVNKLANELIDARFEILQEKDKVAKQLSDEIQSLKCYGMDNHPNKPIA